MGSPFKVSTSVIIEAIKDFLEDPDTGNISLSEIHLLDNRKADGQAFVDAMSKRFKTKKSSKSKKPSSFPKPIGKHITADNEILGRLMFSVVSICLCLFTGRSNVATTLDAIG